MKRTWILLSDTAVESQIHILKILHFPDTYVLFVLKDLNITLKLYCHCQYIIHSLIILLFLRPKTRSHCK